MTTASAGTCLLEDLVDEANGRFQRLRHGRGGDDARAAVASAASVDSVAYIESFWGRLVEAVAEDPAGLGASVETEGGERLTVAALRGAMAAGRAAGRPVSATALREVAAFAPLVVQTRVLGLATTRWADDLEHGRLALPYAIDAHRFVSLRALLPHRAAGDDAVGGNAPTLVMGGTATALALCWNLLHRVPTAWFDLAAAAPARSDLEAAWAASRELLFRLGSGSLAAFSALASACSSNSAHVAWDRAGGLGLVRLEGRLAWQMDGELAARYREILERLVPAQQGHYVGCAALHARAAPLPLAAPWADAVDPARPAIVFNELLRWVTALARAEFFPLFD